MISIVEERHSSKKRLNSRRDHLSMSAINRYISGKKKPVRILDVGCHEADFLFQLADNNQSSTPLILDGLEIVNESVRIAKSRNHALGSPINRIWQMDIERESPEQEYEIILMREIIEHLREPEKCITRLMENLKLGGLLILTSINAGGVLRRAAKLVDRFVKGRLRNLYWSGSSKKTPPPMSSMPGFKENKILGHISSKSVEHWRQVVEKAGYEMSRWIPTMLFPGSVFFDKNRSFFNIAKMLDDISYRLSWGVRTGTGFLMECLKTNNGFTHMRPAFGKAA